MTPSEQMCLKSYVLCIRKMLDGIEGLGIRVPRTVRLWVQELETMLERLKGGEGG